MDGVTGLLVPANDPGALAEGIAALLADKPRRERFEQAGRQRVERAFSLPPIVKAIGELYRRCARRERE